MALFVPGMLCRLCGQPMTAEHEIVMFRPFVPNERDPLFQFSDVVLHASCFRQHPLSEKAVKLHERAIQSSRPGNRVCIVCGQAILAPDDYFGAGLVSSNPASPLFEFNFVQLHCSHLSQWDRFEDFRRLVSRIQDSDAWEGPRIAFGSPPHRDLRWVAAPSHGAMKPEGAL